jgi:hypothetical protein
MQGRRIMRVRIAPTPEEPTVDDVDDIETAAAGTAGADSTNGERRG